MNLSKKIDISKSSLVSLRAELARKQDEVIKAKAQSQAQFIRPLPKPKSEKNTVFSKKNEGIDSRCEKDYEELKEEEDLLKKSRRALESKSKLYDELSRNSETLDEDDSNRYLVDFQQKEQFVANKPSPPVTDDDSDSECDPEDDWVDYVDCVGRTRRCLRRDLPAMKERDRDLAGTVMEREDPPREPEQLEPQEQRELMRDKWEQQEQSLRHRSDIHYQDVLFDEARAHGVAYYGFSGDETQRAAQQAALHKLREDTRREQEAAHVQRERRHKQLAARLTAARNRQRIKQGLPIVDEEPPAAPDPAPEVLEPPAALPEETRKPQPVRPWDVGKEKHVMSQEEWTRKRRKERYAEFAPPCEHPSAPWVQPGKRKQEPCSSASSSSSAAVELENSIMAGLRYLREQADRKQSVKEKGLLDIV